MTAIISLVQSDAVHFLTDGAMKDHAGGFSPVQKVISICHLPAIVVVRGPAVLLLAAAGQLSVAQTFDELCECASASLMAAEKTAFELMKSSAAGENFDCYMAGFRKGVGWCAYVMTNHFNYGFVPFTLQRMPDLSFAPSEGAVSEVVTGIRRAGVAADDFNPATDGLRIMRAQRKEGGPEWAGGFCQLTTATAEGVRSRILERWSGDFERSGT